MCLQIVSESLTSIVMVKIYCSEMFRTWIKIRCLFQDPFVKTFLFIIPSLSRPWNTNISCFGETTTKFNIHTNIWIWHWASIQVKPIPSSMENYLFQIYKKLLDMVNSLANLLDIGWLILLRKLYHECKTMYAILL